MTHFYTSDSGNMDSVMTPGNSYCILFCMCLALTLTEYPSYSGLPLPRRSVYHGSRRRREQQVPHVPEHAFAHHCVIPNLRYNLMVDLRYCRE